MRFAERFASPDEYLTFDDVLLQPALSDVLPHTTDLTAQVTRRQRLGIPVVAAAMDTVTESRLAIALGQLGGLGVVHKNLSEAAQADHVAAVKAFEVPEKTLSSACLARDGRLVCAAAVGAGDATLSRAAAMVAAGADILVVDTAHGHSRNVLRTLADLKQRWPQLEVIAGNVATAAAVTALVQAGADAVKVGIGPGSICTTRIVAGVGVPQLSAVLECAEAAQVHGIPVIADGGIRFSGDMVKALAAGAGTVMLGSLLAATEEAPGESLLIDGRIWKRYRGMGSLAAMAQGSKDRYFQDQVQEPGKLVPEGVEGRLVSQGPLAQVIHLLLGGLRSGMGYVGAANLAQLRRARFVRMTGSGLRESHTHEIVLTSQAPNYR